MIADPQRRATVFFAVTAAFVVALALLPPIRQNPNYHRFADQRSWSGIPNAANVLSNLPLIIVAAWGCVAAARQKNSTLVVVFAGLLLTGIGSTWYHLSPSNARLFWDRLPLGLAAMGLLALAVEWHTPLSGSRMLVPLLGCAAAAAVIWRVTGNLKWWWAIVEIYPLLAIALLLLLYRTSSSRRRALVLIVLCLAAAQIADTLDATLYDLVGLSGHSLKHLVGAVAGVVLFPPTADVNSP